MRIKRLSSTTLLVGGLVAAGLALGSCVDSSLDLPTGGDLEITLTITPGTVTAGGEVLVSASSVGTQLLGTILDYGDGFVDSIPAAGAQTQTVNCPKGYNQEGTFIIQATIQDASQGDLTRVDTLEVQAGPGSLPPSGPSRCENPGG